MEIQIMHTLDGHFACWTATARADKCGAALSWPTPAVFTSPPEALLRYTRGSRPCSSTCSFGGSHELRAQV